MKKKIFVIFGIVLIAILLKLIADYSGAQKELAAKAKNEEIKKELQEIEEKRIEEEQQKQLEIDQERKNYAAKLPYEGMKEVFIDDTIVGKHQKYDSTGTVSKYYWYSANGEDLVLVVSCKNEAVMVCLNFITSGRKQLKIMDPVTKINTKLKTMTIRMILRMNGKMLLMITTRHMIIGKTTIKKQVDMLL